MTTTRRPPSVALEHSLSNLAACGLSFRASTRRCRGRDWINADRLFGGRGGRLRRLLKLMRARHPGLGDDVLGCTTLATYSWPVVGTAMSCFLLDCRVPVLSLENLDLRFDADARVTELAFRSGAVFVLDNDPLQATAEMAGVADLAPLRRFLHAELENHFAPVVQRIRELLPVGSRAAWGNVGDKLIQAAAWIANRCRDNANGSAPRLYHGLDVVREVELLVGRPDSPFFNRRAGLSLGSGGRAVAERGSCCLQYRAPSGRYCANCPVQRRQEARIAPAAR